MNQKTKAHILLMLVVIFASGLLCAACMKDSVHGLWPCDTDAECSEGWSCARAQGSETGKCIQCSGTFHIFLFNDHSGSIAEISQPNTAGMVDHLNHLNDLDGGDGIHGCGIDWTFHDTQYDVNVAKQIFYDWTNDPNSRWNDVSTIIGMGTPIVQYFGTQMNDHKRVLFSSSFNADYASPNEVTQNVSIPNITDDFEERTIDQQMGSPGYRYVFSTGTDYSTQARVAVSFAALQGGHRMSMFGCSTSPYCTTPMNAAKAFVNVVSDISLGRDLEVPLDPENYRSDSDGQAYINEIVLEYFQEELDHADANPGYEPVDWIWFGNTRKTAIMFAHALDAAKTHFDGEKRQFDVKVIANNWAVDEGFRDAVGPLEACGYCREVWYGVQPFSTFENSTPELLNVYENYRNADLGARTYTTDHATNNIEYVYGYTSVLLWEKALTQLILNSENGQINASDVTGDMLLEILEDPSFEPGDFGGLTAAPVHFTPTDHRPQMQVYVFQLDGRGELTQTPAIIELERRDDWLGW